jgi:hypothetical protein
MLQIEIDRPCELNSPQVFERLEQSIPCRLAEGWLEGYLTADGLTCIWTAAPTGSQNWTARGTEPDRT